MIELVNRDTGELLDTDSVPGLAEVAQLHDVRIEELREVVEELLEGQECSGGGPQFGRPVVWHELSRAESARTWRALSEWVGWLRGRYPLARHVPLCWWRHPELVEELTALWMAWRDAYVVKGAPLSAAADWHGRWLPELLRRIGSGGWKIACEGEHKERVAGLYDARTVDDPTQFEALTGSAFAPVTAGEEEDIMQDDSMQEALATGDARRLGELPGSPIAHDGRYWMLIGDAWVPVASEETAAFLADAERRLALADAAIDEQPS